jgi:hypothetical protein
MEVKIYLVLQRLNVFPEGSVNVRIIAAKLTRDAAQKIVDQMPGTYIERFWANKA